MPEMTGVELATRVRVEYPRIKALYMSGYAESSVVEQGMITSETAFLRKPFTTVELNERIREVLDGPRGA
jgi:YesN/AraC family two-component response regulator